MKSCRIFFILFLVTTNISVFSQVNDSLPRLQSSLPVYIQKLSKRSSQLDNKIVSKTEKTLKQFSRQEEKLRRKLFKIDSNAAKEIFTSSKEKIEALSSKLNIKETVTAGNITEYIPKLDSQITSLKFLQNYNGKIPGKENITGALDKLKSMQDKLQSAEEIKKFLKERRQQLRAQLSKFGFAKELKKLNKQVYYFSAQLNEYKQIIRDPRKIEKKAMETLTKLPAFQQFMKKNSMLASLFRMPDDGTDMQASLAGLQTRADIQQLIQGRIGAAGSSGIQALQQNIQAAHGQLDELKNKVMQAGGGGSDAEMPDFKPNNQKTKSFLQRIELGTNFQTSSSNQFFPVTSDIGLSVGYKANDKSIIGIGASYKLGLGSNWNNIKFTHQGIGLRSFIDWKLKGSFFLAGGYEMNYRTQFNSFNQLKNYSQWQASGLMGLSKVVDMKSKFFKKTKVQLLYDFLWKQQVPRGQQVNFRVGYNF
jgi:hypothetical protein